MFNAIFSGFLYYVILPTISNNSVTIRFNFIKIRRSGPFSFCVHWHKQLITIHTYIYTVIYQKYNLYLLWTSLFKTCSCKNTFCGIITMHWLTCICILNHAQLLSNALYTFMFLLFIDFIYYFKTYRMTDLYTAKYIFS